ncbi:lantibiotic protein [Streptomyces eurocidicus]|uniref:Lantibiotic protein n=1 Tax=Streptomyces eurocidicus TaxID=66423 RepID=A0A2N8P0Y0_STREU|nr:thiazolylpeptide-type bacteriocin [Streptomyces eurocidicus]MBB5121806.1 thiazolylpeptide-type bacteriocin precursor [Streptomyces eurocidicus]MBF6055072.1 thiazolylpeptide-type bacteriocin [Streptomyces eurocidicus]PNE34677.1 lantibiotic protein [Streptomyces eurocidicus]
MATNELATLAEEMLALESENFEITDYAETTETFLEGTTSTTSSTTSTTSCCA